MIAFDGLSMLIGVLVGLMVAVIGFTFAILLMTRSKSPRENNDEDVAQLNDILNDPIKLKAYAEGASKGNMDKARLVLHRRIAKLTGVKEDRKKAKEEDDAPF